MSIARILACLVLTLAVCLAFGREGVITLTAFPTVEVANGRSTITIKAEVRDNRGALVPDGTQILFDTNLGSFRQNVLTTVNGFASALLVASASPGRARITATAAEFNASALMTFDFVESKAQLSSAKEYFEIVSRGSMVYSSEWKVIEAAGPNKGVTLRYRDIQIEADDLQLSVPGYEVKARKARIKIGRESAEYDELLYNLREKTGTGIGERIEQISKPGVRFPFLRANTTERIGRGPVSIDGLKNEPMRTPLAPTTFAFRDLSETLTLVTAQRIVAFPRREIQFQNAAVLYQGTKVLRVPYYQLSASSPLPPLSDQFIEMTGSQLAVNYPYYTSMRPGQTSLLRMRIGNRYGVGSGASRGVFMDYEIKWNKGDESEGGLDVTSLGRKDWGLSARQFFRFDDRSSGTFQLDTPANRSVFGSMNLSRQFTGFAGIYSGSLGKSLRGVSFTQQSHYMTLEKDPTTLGRFPARFYTGLTANANQYRSGSQRSTQLAYGVRSRLQSNTFRFGPRTSVDASFAVSKLYGKNVNAGLTTTGAVTFLTQIARNLSTRLTYDYRNDGFNSKLLGQHALSMYTRLEVGSLSASFNVNKSLGVARLVGYGDASYRVTPLIRLGAGITTEQFAGSKFTDSTFFVGYTLGIREVGLSWSQRTRRIGLEILGSTLP
ncbi:MAG: hypothetical protein JNM85_02815 [Chthonomonas sp.]|nr:hypothetical protein [Chthonomonas sp.]